MATQNSISNLNLNISNLNVKKVLAGLFSGIFVTMFLFSFYYLIPIIILVLWKE